MRLEQPWFFIVGILVAILLMIGVSLFVSRLYQLIRSGWYPFKKEDEDCNCGS